MLRVPALAAISIFMYVAGLTLAAQAQTDEIRLQATVQSVVPLSGFSGPVVAVDVDPRFALTVHIESVIPATAKFTEGSDVTLAIHSPSLLFAGEPKEGTTYDFCLRRKSEGGTVRFFALRIAKHLLAPDSRAQAGHNECAEDNAPVAYPLKGWIGFTNTGDSVSEMTVKAFASGGDLVLATVQTDTMGRFSFPTLGPGTYYLKGTRKGVGAPVIAGGLVTVRKGQNRIACLVAEFSANEGLAR
jgi:hypothetical protein